MNSRFKAIGVDPGDVALGLGNCLELRRSPDVVRTPLMYAKVRGSAMGWMSSIGAAQELVFRDELFSSEVVLAHDERESQQPGNSSEGAVLVAALLIAFPDARFAFGLQGGTESLSLLGDYRSLGTHPVRLHDGDEERALVTKVFDYLSANSYWVDDDLVHLLALLTDVCQDRDRVAHGSVLSLSTSGNHRVDPGVFHAYQLVEALLELRDREPLGGAVARWNARYPLQLDPDKVNFIRDVRDVCLHFKPQRAEGRLRDTRVALGFDQDHSEEREFRRHGVQKLLREAAQAFVVHRA